MHAAHAVPSAAGSGGTASLQAWSSFRRIVDVPFGTCVAALESGQLAGATTANSIAGQGLVCGPVETGPGLRDLPGPGPPGPRAAAPAAADEAAGRPLVLLTPAHRAGTHPLRARPAQRRLLPRQATCCWTSWPPRWPGPRRPSARAGATSQPATRGPGPAWASQISRPAGPVPGMALPDRRPGPTSGQASAAPAPSRTAQHQSTAGQEHDLARFMDFHEDLKLPAEAIAQITEDTRNAGGPTGSASARSSCTTTPTARCTACSKGQTKTPYASTTPPLACPAVMCTR